MPLGIPKVTYSRFTDDKPTWIGLYERLYKERALFLCKEIKRYFATRFIGLLLQLDSETDLYDDTDDDNDISIYINSLGGDTYQSIAIYDVLQVMSPEVSTIAMGLVASGASLILSGGTFTRRIAYPNARILIDEPRTIPTSTRKNIDSFIKETEDMLELRNIIVDIYAESTGKLVDVIQKDMERDYDYYMSATEAKDYGIIDRFARLKKENE